MHGDFTGTPVGIVALVLFVIGYVLVVSEDLIELRKSKPVVLMAGAIWVLVAIAYGSGEDMAARVKHHLADFAELFLFLMVAMTYISAISERKVFLRLNAWLVGSGYGLRAVFWMTGLLAFFISPIADNMTTALVMGTVVVTVAGNNRVFAATACTNIVVAANAGGAFSPFGDITTLMVWQAGKVPTLRFIEIFLPSLVDWLIPALIMHMAIPRQSPEPLDRPVRLGSGWLTVIILFLATIATAICFHGLLHLPPFLGMMTGLGYYFVYGYFRHLATRGTPDRVDVLKNVAEVEWDTLLFFFGVIMCVGGLAELGYLAKASDAVYGGIGAFWANVSVGILSAIIDNVPVMFAVLGMDPEMETSQWLLVTLTAGVGGSLLSVGSAAGVALMGTAPGRYTFLAHLRWTPAIAVGYAAAVATHVGLQRFYG